MTMKAPAVETSRVIKEAVDDMTHTIRDVNTHGQA